MPPQGPDGGSMAGFGALNSISSLEVARLLTATWFPTSVLQRMMQRVHPVLVDHPEDRPWLP